MITRKCRLGIMVTERANYPPFYNSLFYKQLCLIGAHNGLIVFVFSPNRINWERRTVEGFRYVKEKQHWEKQVHPLPDMIYDRYFYISQSDYLHYRKQVRQLLQNHRVKFLSHGLRGKWQVKELLSVEKDIAPYIPETEEVKGIQTVQSWLNEHHELFLKPQGSSQGKGVMHIAAMNDSRFRYIVVGRDGGNRLYKFGFYQMEGLAAWLKTIINRRKYIIQPYLQLQTLYEEPFDVRSFVQKDKLGRWQLVGLAVRKGKPGSLTSNLHGGGDAEKAASFLSKHFDEIADALLDRIQTLSMKIAHSLEARHGRLLELGIDFGIDRSGHLWLLEVNSKPGRSIFIRTGNVAAKRSSLSNPILYARYLWDRQLGG